jgi:hypothetical protein
VISLVTTLGIVALAKHQTEPARGCDYGQCNANNYNKQLYRADSGLWLLPSCQKRTARLGHIVGISLAKADVVGVAVHTVVVRSSTLREPNWIGQYSALQLCYEHLLVLVDAEGYTGKDEQDTKRQRVLQDTRRSQRPTGRIRTPHAGRMRPDWHARLSDFSEKL